jgi:hypothetical protein
VKAELQLNEVTSVELNSAMFRTTLQMPLSEEYDEGKKVKK